MKSTRNGRRARKVHHNHVLADMGIVVLSILIAIILVKTNILVQILSSTRELELVGSFFAGMFFTSVFTTAPAVATLGQIAVIDSLTKTVLIGALGAVIGDIIMFRFIRDRLSESMMELLREEGVLRRVRILLKHRTFRWSAFLLGGILIAAPLPTDEIGITLMGFAKAKLWMFVAVSYFFNAIGIALIGITARALAS